MNRETAKWYIVPIMIWAAAFHSHGRADPGQRFTVQLSGSRQASPQSVVTRTKADFRFDRDFTVLRYSLSILNKGAAVLDIRLHCGSQEASGPAVATLLGRMEGGLTGKAAIRASLADANLIPDSDCVPATGTAIHDLRDLADAMERGAIYINVATAANPEGEFRAQVAAPGTALGGKWSTGNGAVPAARAAVSQAIQAQMQAQSALAQAAMARAEIQAATAQAAMAQVAANQNDLSSASVRATVQAAAQRAVQSANMAVSEASIARTAAVVAAQLADMAVRQAAGQGPIAERKAQTAVKVAQQALIQATQARSEAQAALQAAGQLLRL
jgi:hypothetical protein